MSMEKILKEITEALVETIRANLGPADQLCVAPWPARGKIIFWKRAPTSPQAPWRLYHIRPYRYTANTVRILTDTDSHLFLPLKFWPQLAKAQKQGRRRGREEREALVASLGPQRRCELSFALGELESVCGPDLLRFIESAFDHADDDDNSNVWCWPLFQGGVRYSWSVRGREAAERDQRPHTEVRELAKTWG
jgi:hypothetical protein